MPDFPPDGPAKSPANGHPETQPPAAPRIAPPVGARAARGESLNDESAPENSLPAVENSQAPTLENSTIETSTIETSVEDSYDFPVELDPESEDEPPVVSTARVPNPDTPKDVELGLMQHLGELRQRLLYCALILIAGMAITWSFSDPMQEWFAKPIRDVIAGKGTIQSTDPMGFFSIKVQFSLVAALILTAPLLFWQVWMFIEPALTKNERRYSLAVVPLSSALFFLGAALAYAVSRLFFEFFVSFQPNGVAANWDYYTSIILLAKSLLAFGIMFQVPVVVIFLNKLGLLSRNVLIEYWRHAVVVIFTVAAVVTPTWDPVTLAVCAVPPCLLYVLSIWLVKWL